MYTYYLWIGTFSYLDVVTSCSSYWDDINGCVALKGAEANPSSETFNYLCTYYKYKKSSTYLKKKSKNKVNLHFELNFTNDLLWTIFYNAFLIWTVALSAIKCLNNCTTRTVWWNKNGQMTIENHRFNMKREIRTRWISTYQVPVRHR